MKKIIKSILLALTLTACNLAFDNSPDKDIHPERNANEVVRTNLSLAIAYLERGKYESALEKLERAKAADPDYSDTYNVFGLLYQQINEYKKAEHNFKKALSLNSNNSPTLNNYGNFLCQQGRLDEALKIFSKAANNPLYQTPEIALTNSGLCLFKNNKKEKAKEQFKHALKINPQVPQALIKMCEFAVDDANYPSARAYLQRYKQVSRYTAHSLWLGIQIERKLGDKDAVSSYALLLKNNFPDSDEAAMLIESNIQ